MAPRITLDIFWRRLKGNRKGDHLLCCTILTRSELRNITQSCTARRKSIDTNSWISAILPISSVVRPSLTHVSINDAYWMHSWIMPINFVEIASFYCFLYPLRSFDQIGYRYEQWLIVIDFNHDS